MLEIFKPGAAETTEKGLLLFREARRSERGQGVLAGTAGIDETSLDANMPSAWWQTRR